ncbi:unnamed protein product [Prunus armeniaca]
MKAKVNFSDAETKGDGGRERREEESKERGEEKEEKNLRRGVLGLAERRGSVSQRREKRRAWKSVGF